MNYGPTRTDDLDVIANVTISQNLAKTLDYLSNVLKLGSIRRVKSLEYRYLVPQISELGNGEIGELGEVQFAKGGALEVIKKIALKDFGISFSRECLIKMLNAEGSEYAQFIEKYSNAINDVVAQDLKNSMIEQIMNCFYIDHRQGILSYNDLKSRNKLFEEEVVSADTDLSKLVKKWLIKGRTLIANRNHLPINEADKFTIILPNGMLDQFLIDRLDAEIYTLVGGIQYLKFNSNVNILFFNNDPVKYYEVDQQGNKTGAVKEIKNYMLMFRGEPFEFLSVDLNAIPLNYKNEFAIDKYGLVATEVHPGTNVRKLEITSQFGVACHLKNTSAPLLVNFMKGA